MICPKCNEEKIIAVTLKKNKDKAYLCSECGIMWYANEDINLSTGHIYDAASQGNELGYTIENEEEKDQEHRSADNTPYT